MYQLVDLYEKKWNARKQVNISEELLIFLFSFKKKKKHSLILRQKKTVFSNVNTMMKDWRASNEFMASLKIQRMHDEHAINQLTNAHSFLLSCLCLFDCFIMVLRYSNNKIL